MQIGCVHAKRYLCCIVYEGNKSMKRIRCREGHAFFMNIRNGQLIKYLKIQETTPGNENLK